MQERLHFGAIGTAAGRDTLCRLADDRGNTGHGKVVIRGFQLIRNGGLAAGLIPQCGIQGISKRRKDLLASQHLLPVEGQAVRPLIKPQILQHTDRRQQRGFLQQRHGEGLRPLLRQRGSGQIRQISVVPGILPRFENAPAGVIILRINTDPYQGGIASLHRQHRFVRTLRQRAAEPSRIRLQPEQRQRILHQGPGRLRCSLPGGEARRDAERRQQTGGGSEHTDQQAGVSGTFVRRRCQQNQKTHYAERQGRGRHGKAERQHRSGKAEHQHGRHQLQAQQSHGQTD